ncbi:DNA alkylation repair protein, partial [Azospirillum sp. C340-1]|nr:DNA alkylation repair protein [Azospirillum isscasi]
MATAPTAAPRKGATRRSDIPPEVLADLNAGRRATATLAESLAIHFAALLAAAVPETAGAVRFDPKDGVTRRMAAAGAAALGRLGPGAVE